MSAARSPVLLKSEPASPPYSFSAEESLWASDTDTGLYWTDDELIEAGLTCEKKVETLTKILDHLDGFEDLSECIKNEEDPFSNYWMEDKLQMYEVPQPVITKHEPKPIANPIQQQNGGSQDTQNLLIEFETVLDAVNNGAFTPPQSPPYQQPILTTLEPYNSNIYGTRDHTYPIILAEKAGDYSPATPQTDVARELAVVDEIVRSRVELLVPSSPGSSSSNYGDSSDQEWSVDLSESYKESSGKTSKRRSKPYSVHSDDKKSRKKEQNKNAATRYRMKKKAEVEEILGEERQLIDHNTGLSTQITDLNREIKYLKGLMRDLFKAKGLIN